MGCGTSDNQTTIIPVAQDNPSGTELPSTNAKINTKDSKGNKNAKGSSLRKTNVKADATPSKHDIRASQSGAKKNDSLRGSSIRESTRSLGKGLDVSPSKVKLNVE